MTFYLIVAKGRHQGLPIAIELDLFLIGAAEACHLRAQHPTLGGEHCALLTRGRQAFVIDYGNGTPTEVNGSALEPGVEWPLHMGDRIRIGPLEFMIQKREKHVSRKDTEEWAAQCLNSAPGKRHSDFDELVESGALTHKGPLPSDIASALLDKLSLERGETHGRIRVSKSEGVMTVRLNDHQLIEEGDITLLNKELSEQLGLPNLKVLIDFKNVRRLSSGGAAMFARLCSAVVSRGGSVAFCRIRSELEPMMRTFPGLDQVKIFRDKELARASRW